MALNDTRSKEVRQVEKSILERGVTFPNTGLKLLDTNASNYLTLKWNENDTSNRTLSLVVSGANRSLTISGDSSVNQALLTTSNVQHATVGLGVAPTTGLLHIKAGTAAAGTAPIKLTSGTLLTAPEAGAIEFLANAYYAGITTGPARKTFAFLESPAFTTPNIGVATATSVTIGGNTLDTTEFANLDGQDQAVKTTSEPTFGSVTVTTNATVASGVVNTDNNQVFYDGDAVSYNEEAVYYV